MAELDRLSFIAIPARFVDAELNAEINEVLAESLEADFPERSPEERAFLLDASARNRHDPNLAVGGPHLQPNQQFRRPMSVIARDVRTRRLWAQLPVADVASGHGGVLSRLEMTTKLRLPIPPFLQARWRWAGLCALSTNARATLESTPSEEGSIIDGLLMAGMSRSWAVQRLEAFPYVGEKHWMQGLAGAGFTHYPGLDAGAIDAFGSGNLVDQETWRPKANSNEGIKGNIYEMRKRLLLKDGLKKVFDDNLPPEL